MTLIASKSLWLPYTQMQTATPPLKVASTLGSRIKLEDGRELIDGIASWWTSCHGYNHPHIMTAIQKQAQQAPHIMLGGLCHEETNRLASRLAALLPGDLNHVFFSESGSVSVEIALKMVLQYWINLGNTQKTKFIAFKGAYHGDTLATMSLCDPDEGMHRRFNQALPHQFIANIPNTPEKLRQLQNLIETNLNDIAGIIIEPLVQGAAGMVMHESSVLTDLSALAKMYNLPLIFDEIFVGFGRTGSLFACQEADVVPDIICLSKALTGGTMPLAATIATTSIFNAFLGKPEMAFMHGPTYMGHALACSAANASLDLFEAILRESKFSIIPKSKERDEVTFQMESRLAPVTKIETALMRLKECEIFKVVDAVRIKGAIAAIDIKNDSLNSPLMMNKIKSTLLDKGLWIRPIGNCLYLTPAFTIDENDLNALINGIIDTCANLT